VKRATISRSPFTQAFHLEKEYFGSTMTSTLNDDINVEVAAVLAMSGGSQRAAAVRCHASR